MDNSFIRLELHCPDLDHAPEECVDFLLTISVVAAVYVVVVLLAPASERRVQLEGPQEVVGLLEVWSDGEDLVDQVLHTDDAVAT